MSETKTGKSLAQVPASCEWDFKSVYGKTLARFKLHYGDFVFKGFRIMRGDDGPWVAFPCVPNKMPGTKKRWVTTAWIEDEKRMADFKKWALRGYESAKPPDRPSRPDTAKGTVTEEEVAKLIPSAPTA